MELLEKKVWGGGAQKIRYSQDFPSKTEGRSVFGGRKTVNQKKRQDHRMKKRVLK